MICPRCGSKMNIDGHRKMDLYMCYDCGYIEGRNMGEAVISKEMTNFERMHKMNLNEVTAFISRNLNVDENLINAWLERRTA